MNHKHTRAHCTYIQTNMEKIGCCNMSNIDSKQIKLTRWWNSNSISFFVVVVRFLFSLLFRYYYQFPNFVYVCRRFFGYCFCYSATFFVQNLCVCVAELLNCSVAKYFISIHFPTSIESFFNQSFKIAIQVKLDWSFKFGLREYFTSSTWWNEWFSPNPKWLVRVTEKWVGFQKINPDKTSRCQQLLMKLFGRFPFLLAVLSTFNRLNNSS